jgi:hypothetical protein
LHTVSNVTDDHQSGSNRTVDRLLHRAEFHLDLKAGTGKQMLQALAEQPITFDQDGTGHGHGRLFPEALMIEQQRDPKRCGVVWHLQCRVGETLPEKGQAIKIKLILYKE